MMTSDKIKFILCLSVGLKQEQAMKTYEETAKDELILWQLKVCRKPSFTNRAAKALQRRVNNLLPERVHEVLTTTIKNMVKAVLFGSGFTAGSLLQGITLQEREKLVQEKLSNYKKIAAVSGAGTGAGGIILGLADLPVLLGIKIKFLFDVAGIYGFDVRDYKERLYILLIFQLAFSSQERRNEVYRQISHWDDVVKDLPKDLNSFDWRTFQQEYRDYIDLAKMLQLVPVIGAVIGAYANYKLLDKLGETAVNSYRLRIFGP